MTRTDDKTIGIAITHVCFSFCCKSPYLLSLLICAFCMLFIFGSAMSIKSVDLSFCTKNMYGRLFSRTVDGKYLLYGVRVLINNPTVNFWYIMLAI